MTDTATIITPQVADPDLANDEPRNAHIVEDLDGPTGKRSASALIMEARVNGTPVTALCGYTWVPERDPAKYPVCPRCVDIAEAIVKGGGGRME